jgi:hypothetical protein
VAGGPQPYAGKNALLSPAATDLGFADKLVQQVQDVIANNQKKPDKNAPDAETDMLTPAVISLYGKGPISGSA